MHVRNKTKLSQLVYLPLGKRGMKTDDRMDRRVNACKKQGQWTDQTNFLAVPRMDGPTDVSESKPTNGISITHLSV